MEWPALNEIEWDAEWNGAFPDWSRQSPRLFGKAYRSDVTGDGPGSQQYPRRSRSPSTLIMNYRSNLDALSYAELQILARHVRLRGRRSQYCARAALLARLEHILAEGGSPAHANSTSSVASPLSPTLITETPPRPGEQEPAPPEPGSLNATLVDSPGEAPSSNAGSERNQHTGNPSPDPIASFSPTVADEDHATAASEDEYADMPPLIDDSDDDDPHLVCNTCEGEAAEDQFAQEGECPICLETGTLRFGWPHCRHALHPLCAARWVRQRATAGCPLCRAGALSPPQRQALLTQHREALSRDEQRMDTTTDPGIHEPPPAPREVTILCCYRRGPPPDFALLDDRSAAWAPTPIWESSSAEQGDHNSRSLVGWNALWICLSCNRETTLDALPDRGPPPPCPASCRRTYVWDTATGEGRWSCSPACRAPSSAPRGGTWPIHMGGPPTQVTARTNSFMYCPLIIDAAGLLLEADHLAWSSRVPWWAETVATMRHAPRPPLRDFTNSYRLSVALARNNLEFVGADDLEASERLARLSSRLGEEHEARLPELVRHLVDSRGHLPALAQELTLQTFAGAGLASSLEQAAELFRSAGTWGGAWLRGMPPNFHQVRPPQMMHNPPRTSPNGQQQQEAAAVHDQDEGSRQAPAITQQVTAGETYAQDGGQQRSQTDHSPIGIDQSPANRPAHQEAATAMIARLDDHASRGMICTSDTTWEHALWQPVRNERQAVTPCMLCSGGIAPGEWIFILLGQAGQQRGPATVAGRCHAACGHARLCGLGAPNLLPPAPAGYPAELVPVWQHLSGGDLTHDQAGQVRDFLRWPTMAPPPGAPPHPAVIVRFWPILGAAADGQRHERIDRTRAELAIAASTGHTTVRERQMLSRILEAADQSGTQQVHYYRCRPRVGRRVSRSPSLRLLGENCLAGVVNPFSFNLDLTRSHQSIMVSFYPAGSLPIMTRYVREGPGFFWQAIADPQLPMPACKAFFISLGMGSTVEAWQRRHGCTLSGRGLEIATSYAIECWAAAAGIVCAFARQMELPVAMHERTTVFSTASLILQTVEDNVLWAAEQLAAQRGWAMGSLHGDGAIVWPATPDTHGDPNILAHRINVAIRVWGLTELTIRVKPWQSQTGQNGEADGPSGPPAAGGEIAATTTPTRPATNMEQAVPQGASVAVAPAAALQEGGAQEQPQLGSVSRPADGEPPSGRRRRRGQATQAHPATTTTQPGPPGNLLGGYHIEGVDLDQLTPEQQSELRDLIRRFWILFGGSSEVNFELRPGSIWVLLWGPGQANGAQIAGSLGAVLSQLIQACRQDGRQPWTRAAAPTWQEPTDVPISLHTALPSAPAAPERPLPQPLQRHPWLAHLAMMPRLTQADRWGSLRAVTLRRIPFELQGALADVFAGLARAVLISAMPTNAAVAWFLLPRLLLLAPTDNVTQPAAISGARPRSRGRDMIRLVRQRLTRFMDGDWLNLFLEAGQGMENRHRSIRPTAEDAEGSWSEKAQSVIRLARQNRLGAARAAVQSHGLVAVDEAAFQTLAAKLVPDPRQQEAPVVDNNAIPRLEVDATHIKDTIKACPPGQSCSLSGLRNEYLQTCLRSADATDAVCELVRAVANGEVPEVLATALMKVPVVPLDKGGGDPRPIAPPDVLYRTACTAALRTHRQKIPRLLRKRSFAVGRRAGVEAMAKAIRALSFKHPDWLFAKIDGANAYQRQFRRKPLEAMTTAGDEEALPLLRLFASRLTRPSTYVVYKASGEAMEIPSHQGWEQGNGAAPLGFTLGLKSTLDSQEQRIQEGATRHAAEPTDAGIFDYLDDLVLACPAAQFTNAFQDLVTALRDETGYVAAWDKLKIWRPIGGAHAFLPAELHQHVAEEGFVILGSPLAHEVGLPGRSGAAVGTTPFVEGYYARAVDSAKVFVTALTSTIQACNPGAPAMQTAQLLLRCCVLPMVNHLARAAFSRHTLHLASAFDAIVRDAARTLLGAPLVGEAEAQVSLPLWAGGCGFARTRDLAAAACLGSWSDAWKCAHEALGWDPLEIVNLQAEVFAAEEDLANLTGEPTAWRLGEHLRVGAIEGDTTPHLQRQLARRVHLANIRRFDERQGPAAKVRRLGCKATWSGTWLVAVPRDPTLTMLDCEFRHAWASRLGTNPRPEWHLGPGERTRRHNLVRDGLRTLLCPITATVTREQREPILGHIPDLRCELHDRQVCYLEVHIRHAIMNPDRRECASSLARWGRSADAFLEEAWRLRLNQYRAQDPGLVAFGQWPFRLVPAVANTWGGWHATFGHWARQLCRDRAESVAVEGVDRHSHAAVLCSRLAQACSVLVVKATARADLAASGAGVEGAWAAARAQAGVWCRDVHQLVLDAGLDAQNDTQLGAAGLNGAMPGEHETGSQESPEQSGCASHLAVASPGQSGCGSRPAVAPQVPCAPNTGERSSCAQEGLMLSGTVGGIRAE